MVRLLRICERGGIPPSLRRRRYRFRAPAWRWDRERFRLLVLRPGGFARRYKPLPF